MSMNAQTFGERVRFYRILRGWDQDELASRIKKSVPTVSRIENGTQNLSLEVILALANALGISPTAFFMDEERELSSTDITLLMLLFRFSHRLPEPILKCFVAMAKEVDRALQDGLKSCNRSRVS